MFRISKTFHISASHRLDQLPATHPCARLHGHNYRIELILESETLDEATGFVVDYRELDAFGAYLRDDWDHRHLNEILDVAPTAEHIARHLFFWAKKRWAATVAVRVSETDKTWATYGERPAGEPSASSF